jgi:hypothetical protein
VVARPTNLTVVVMPQSKTSGGISGFWQPTLGEVSASPLVIKFRLFSTGWIGFLSPAVEPVIRGAQAAMPALDSEAVSAARSVTSHR